jgi:hypothetical protein
MELGTGAFYLEPKQIPNKKMSLEKAIEDIKKK